MMIEDEGVKFYGDGNCSFFSVNLDFRNLIFRLNNDEVF